MRLQYIIDNHRSFMGYLNLNLLNKLEEEVAEIYEAVYDNDIPNLKEELADVVIVLNAIASVHEWDLEQLVLDRIVQKEDNR